MLFLADVDHANCAKIKLTRRHPPTGRRAGRFLGSSKVPDRQKETAALKMNRPLSSRQVKKEKLCHEGLVPVSKGSQAL